MASDIPHVRLQAQTKYGLDMQVVWSSAVGAILGAVIAGTVNSSLFEISDTPYCRLLRWFIVLQLAALTSCFAFAQLLHYLGQYSSC